MQMKIQKIGVIGAGVMGMGIVQIAIQSGHDVVLFDSKERAAVEAQEKLTHMLNRLVEKAKLSPEKMQQDLAHLHIADDLADLQTCDLIIEAIIENLQIKQQLIQQLESLVAPTSIIASNTSSLSITAIAANARYPERIAGYHFFNPVPLMKVVEVIQGFHTRTEVLQALTALALQMGHCPVQAKDTPGFIINHAGRAFSSEAYAMLSENVSPFYDIDRIYRDGIGFKMGPFELVDLTGMDVSHPVSESIYRQYYEEPRYRPNINTQQRFTAKQLGRKVGQGFYDYSTGQKVGDVASQHVERLVQYPKVWLSTDFEKDRQILVQYLHQHHIEIDEGVYPCADALILIANYGEDATSAAVRLRVPAQRVICIDLLYGFHRHRTLMPSLLTQDQYIHIAHSIFNLDGQSLSMIAESVGFVAQRVLAMIVNLGCDMAQQKIASVDDINRAVKLGLAYPFGSIEWGDILGAEKILLTLNRISAISHDPRYRPSPWLRRRVQLHLPLVFQGHEISKGSF